MTVCRVKVCSSPPLHRLYEIWIKVTLGWVHREKVWNGVSLEEESFPGLNWNSILDFNCYFDRAIIKLQKRIQYYTLMVYEDADATLLRLFECFMESAPQLVLQVATKYFEIYLKMMFVKKLKPFIGLLLFLCDWLAFLFSDWLMRIYEILGLPLKYILLTFQIYILIKDPHASRILDENNDELEGKLQL